jgi:hypothetical protein
MFVSPDLDEAVRSGALGPRRSELGYRVGVVLEYALAQDRDIQLGIDIGQFLDAGIDRAKPVFYALLVTPADAAANFRQCLGIQYLAFIQVINGNVGHDCISGFNFKVQARVSVTLDLLIAELVPTFENNLKTHITD